MNDKNSCASQLLAAVGALCGLGVLIYVSLVGGVAGFIAFGIFLWLSSGIWFALEGTYKKYQEREARIKRDGGDIQNYYHD